MRVLDVKHFLVFFRFFRLFLLHLFALLLNHLFRSTTKNTRILDISYSCFFLFPMHFFTHLLILSLPNFWQIRKSSRPFGLLRYHYEGQGQLRTVALRPPPPCKGCSPTVPSENHNNLRRLFRNV